MLARRTPGEDAAEHERAAVIALIDYGAGNLTSVRKALSALDAHVATPARPDELDRAAGIIVPGVGHFAATGALDQRWRDAILARVRGGVPLLGICLGMQWLFDGSEEAPDHAGLGLITGRCARLDGPVKVPHVGWNSLETKKPSRLLAGVDNGAQVYFTHSYAAPVTPECAAVTTHAASFAAAVEHDQIFGVQFHPEKSSDAGLQILRNFLDVVETNHRVS
jgi:imidazole glycerol-phosphate synthase subunit HisH